GGADDYDQIIVQEERRKRETGTWKYEPTDAKAEPKPVILPPTSTPSAGKPGGEPPAPKEEARDAEDEITIELDDTRINPKPIEPVREAEESDDYLSDEVDSPEPTTETSPKEP